MAEDKDTFPPDRRLGEHRDPSEGRAPLRPGHIEMNLPPPGRGLSDLPASPRAGDLHLEVTAPPPLTLRTHSAKIDLLIDQPAVLIQATVVEPRGKTEEGVLVVASGDVWRRIVRDLQRDPALLHSFAKNPRLFEEFIAATFTSLASGTTLF